MVRGVCKVFLIGRAGADGDLRYTPAGHPILRVSLATESGLKRGSGSSTAGWHRVIITGPQAESRDNAVRKGCMCFVEGTLRTRAIEGKPLAQRITEVVVGADGTFRVYDTGPPVEKAVADHDRPSPSSALSPKARLPGSRLASAYPAPNGRPAESTVVDDEWLSFEGLLLHDRTDAPD